MNKLFELMATRFLHVSDTHLGCRVPSQLAELREQDFIEAFRQAVELAIKESVDFIVHSGDLFHQGNVSPRILIETVKILKDLKREGIPFIAIKGNHDIKGTRAITAFDILRELELIVEPTIKNPFIHEQTSTAIYGFSEIKTSPERLKEIYHKVFYALKSFEAPKSYDYSILLTHTVTKKYNIPRLAEDPRYLPVEIYPSGVFSYIALGHYHRVQEPFNLSGSLFVLPGSTERTEISEAELEKPKGVMLVSNGQASFRQLNTRRFVIREFTVSDESSFEELKRFLVHLEPEVIAKLLIKLTGKQYRKLVNDLVRNYKNVIAEIISLEEEAGLEIPSNVSLAKTIQEILEETVRELLLELPEERREYFHNIIYDILAKLELGRQAIERYLTGRYLSLERLTTSPSLASSHGQPRQTLKSQPPRLSSAKRRSVQKTLFDEL